MILGFLYTFALIAYAGGEVGAIEFSTYENIWTLINALQTVAYAVLISVMFSTFIILPANQRIAAVVKNNR